MKDLFGNALLDYQRCISSGLRQAQSDNSMSYEDLITSTSISDDDVLPLPYLFRDYNDMPLLEQKALELCKGTVLDVGCGAGGHSLYLQNKSFDIKAIDVSKGAIEVAKQRGIVNAELKALLDETETFDTILLLMNGTGIFQTLKDTSKYLKHLKTLLNPDGQILIDSSDIKYMYKDEDDPDNYQGWLDANSNYYGELDYYLSYKGKKETPMKWLYLDFNTLKTACQSVGLNCEKIMDGEHYDYLARLF